MLSDLSYTVGGIKPTQMPLSGCSVRGCLVKCHDGLSFINIPDCVVSDSKIQISRQINSVLQ